MKKEIVDLINQIETFISDPSKGLPEEIFLFVTRITPMINVDLLIKNEKGETLLVWREDKMLPPGWHVPGGIIRYKEPISERIKKVARNELKADVDFEPDPIAINEIILPDQRNRGHFISLLYRCKLKCPPDRSLMYIGGKPKNGQWAWHKKCPDNLIPVHFIYKKYIEG